MLNGDAGCQGTGSCAPLLCWQSCGPQAMRTAAPWSACLPPGVTALVDASGDEAQHWLPVLAAHSALQTAADATAPSGHQQPLHASSVAWLPASAAAQQAEQAVGEWLQTWCQSWPQWDEAAWQCHVAGFALQAQLGKPLTHLSTGTWRKLQLAAMLASGATLTLIDAPTAGLDQASVRYLAQALQALGDAVASQRLPQRWVLVAHWEPLPGVDWQQVLHLPPCWMAPEPSST